MNATRSAIALSADALLLPECLHRFRTHTYLQAGAWLRSHLEDPWLPAWVADLHAQQQRDLAAGRMAPSHLRAGSLDDPGFVSQLCTYVTTQVREEREVPVISRLTSRMLAEALQDGTLKAQMFDDVPRMAERWKKRGIALALYARWSAAAVEGLLEHSDRGDLRHTVRLIQAAEDADVRTSEAFYLQMAELLQVTPTSLRVAGCDLDEMYAAANAGCEAVLLERQGIFKPGEHRFRTEVTLLAL